MSDYVGVRVCACTNAIVHRVHGHGCATTKYLEEEGAAKLNHVAT